MEENPDHFSRVNITQLILQAVAGNAKPLKDAIRTGVTDEAKRDVLSAAADELVIEQPSSTYTGSTYRFARDFIRKKRKPEEYKQEKDRQQALAFFYSNQILDTEKQLSAGTITRRLAVLKSLPIGSKVSISLDGGSDYFFSTAGVQKATNKGKEFLILRSPNGGYAAIDVSKKQITYQKDRFTAGEVHDLSIPAAIRGKVDPTVLYLAATPTA